MQTGNDALWVIVDRLTKSARFIPMNCRWEMEQLARAYIKYVVRFHGVPRTIVSDRDTVICHISRRLYNRPWGLHYCIVRLFIRRLMDKRKGQIRF